MASILYGLIFLLRSFYIWTVERDEEFAPLKNAESAGVDCLSTCQKALAEQSRRWLTKVGAIIQVNPIYVRSGASYDGEVSPICKPNYRV